jgi:hypothetical protein
LSGDFVPDFYQMRKLTGEFMQLPVSETQFNKYFDANRVYADFIRLSHRHIIAKTEIDVVKIPKMGPTRPTVKSEWAGAFPTLANFAFDDKSIYWITYDYTTQNSKVSGFEDTGIGINEITTTEGPVTRIVPHQDFLFLIKASAGTNSISYMHKDGTNETFLFDAGNTEIKDIYAYDDLLYVLLGNQLVSINILSSDIVVLENDLANTLRLYVDDTHVYWTEDNLCNIFRTNRSGGEKEKIFSIQMSDCNGIQGDADNVFLAVKWLLLKIPKEISSTLN